MAQFLACSCFLFSGLDSASETNSHFHPLPSGQSEELLYVGSILNVLLCVFSISNSIVIPCLSLDGWEVNDVRHCLFFWLRILS